MSIFTNGYLLYFSFQICGSSKRQFGLPRQGQRKSEGPHQDQEGIL